MQRSILPMTLIASVSNPRLGACLIGDTMLSNAHGLTIDDEVQFPFMGNINKRVGERLKFSAARHAQKLISIRHDLCLAWSGSADGAYTAAHYLRDQVDSGLILSANIMSDFAECFIQKDLDIDFILLAVLLDGSYFICSNVVSWEFENETIFRVGGSGCEDFTKMLYRVKPAFNGRETGAASLLMATLGYVGAAFLEQFTNIDCAKNGWGGMIEAAFYDGVAIKKVSPLTVFFWSAIQYEPGKWALALLPMFIHQYAAGESTINVSWHIPSKSVLLVAASSPFSLQTGPIDAPKSYPTNAAIHIVQLGPSNGAETVRAVVNFYSDRPDHNGLKIQYDGGRIGCPIGGYWREIARLLPEGHEIARLLEWTNYNPVFDWVSEYFVPPR